MADDDLPLLGDDEVLAAFDEIEGRAETCPPDEIRAVEAPTWQSQDTASVQAAEGAVDDLTMDPTTSMTAVDGPPDAVEPSGSSPGAGQDSPHVVGNFADDAEMQAVLACIDSADTDVAEQVAPTDSPPPTDSPRPAAESECAPGGELAPESDEVLAAIRAATRAAAEPAAPKARVVRFKIGKQPEAQAPAPAAAPQPEEAAAPQGAPSTATSMGAAASAVTAVAMMPRATWFKRVYRCLDWLLEGAHRPFGWVPAGVRDVAGWVGLTLIFSSLAGGLLVDFLLPRRDALSYLRDRVAQTRAPAAPAAAQPAPASGGHGAHP